MRNRKTAYAALALAAVLSVQMATALTASAIYDPNAPALPATDANGEPLMHIMTMSTDAVTDPAQIPMLISENPEGIMPISAPVCTVSAVTWSGKNIDLGGLKPYLAANGQTMIPLRVVAEAMGYTVTWNKEANQAELSRGAHWVTVRLGADAYTFARMAPMPLGTASEVVAGRTYVPVNFFSDLLPYAAAVNDKGTLEIKEVAQPAAE